MRLARWRGHLTLVEPWRGAFTWASSGCRSACCCSASAPSFRMCRRWPDARADRRRDGRHDACGDGQGYLRPTGRPLMRPMDRRGLPSGRRRPPACGWSPRSRPTTTPACSGLPRWHGARPLLSSPCTTVGCCFRGEGSRRGRRMSSYGASMTRSAKCRGRPALPGLFGFCTGSRAKETGRKVSTWATAIGKRRAASQRA